MAWGAQTESDRHGLHRAADGLMTHPLSCYKPPSGNNHKADTPLLSLPRSTTKYWVRNRDLEMLQAEIGRHLPLLIYQKQQQQQQQQQGQPTEERQPQNAGLAGVTAGVTAGGLHEDAKAAAASLPASSAAMPSSAAVPQPVTSVYFDSPDLSVYCSRLAREDGATLVRVR